MFHTRTVRSLHGMLANGFVDSLVAFVKPQTSAGVAILYFRCDRSTFLYDSEHEVALAMIVREFPGFFLRIF